MQKKVGKISSLLNPITYVIINIAIVVLVYSGGIQVDIGDLTQGQVVALYNYMSQILVELIKLANLLVTITKALACADRIKSVFEQESTLEHNDNKSNSDSYIEFKREEILPTFFCIFDIARLRLLNSAISLASSVKARITSFTSFTIHCFRRYDYGIFY